MNEDFRCFDNCGDDYRVGNIIGQLSANGIIYKSCCNERYIEIDNCNYVTKEIGQRYIPISNFIKEIKLQLKASENNLAPRIQMCDYRFWRSFRI